MAKLHIVLAAPLIALGKAQSKVTFDNNAFLRLVFNAQKDPSPENVGELKKVMKALTGLALRTDVLQSGKKVNN